MSKVIYHEAFAKTIILNRKFTVLKKMDRTSFISSYNSRKQSSRRQVMAVIIQLKNGMGNKSHKIK